MDAAIESRAVTTPHDEGALQLAVVQGESVAVYGLAAGAVLTIGRADDNDVRVEDSAVSRKHAALHVGPPMEIEDLGAANGTLLRGAAPPGGDPLATAALRNVRSRRAPVAVGDAIVIGGVVAVVRRAPSASPQATIDSVIVHDPSMKALYAQAGRAAQAMLPVLILGETGVGKDVLARAIHRASPRAKGPFLALNCAALSENLLEGELFGHEKGSFTGATAAKAGLIEAAEGGTLFLDEAGELPLSTQVKLLRVLEQREVMRVGGRSPRTVDVRFVAATNRDLEAASQRGAFREDLYFRLNGISLTVPPLRERRGDIGALAPQLLAAASRQMDRAHPPTLSPAALAVMEAYPWPGNVRELRHALERALVVAEGSVILPEHLPPKVLASARSPVSVVTPLPRAAEPAAPMDPRERGLMEWKAADRQRILDALTQCDGNQTRAAELLGVSRRTLLYRIEEYGIGRPRKRP